MCAAALGAALWFAPAAPAAQFGSRPQAAEQRPQPVCVRDVQLGLGEGAERVTLLLGGGRILGRQAADAPPPPGHILVDGTGLIALPAFVDAFTTRGVTTPSPTPDRDEVQDPRADVWVDMRPALRRGLNPAFRAVDTATLSAEHLDAWRAAGFGYALQSPSGELLSGRAALVSLREGALRERVVRGDVAMHASFSSTGGGYPGTLMGRIAHLRQFALDAAHFAELSRRQEAGLPGPRPPYDPDLEVAAQLASGELPLLCAAERPADLSRWLRLAEEFGWRPVALGGRELGADAERLANRGLAAVLTLAWGDEVDDPREPKKKKDAPDGRSKEEAEPELATDEVQVDADGGGDEPSPETDAAPDDAEAASASPKPYEEPFALRLEKRLEWEKRRDTAIALALRGVPFAFGTADEAPGDLLRKVRELVEAGLPEEAALEALSDGARRVLGAGGPRSLDDGSDASLALWSANPLTDKKARVEWMIVEGHLWRAPAKKESGAGNKDEEKR
ncbi:MAG: hypothetical protein GC161_04950 [Planctomycetaceae bacterium]|nr:hypothetical protein [Planctomycetaceae bacterium]